LARGKTFSQEIPRLPDICDTVFQRRNDALSQFSQIGLTMQIPVWTKPALLGAGAGAVAMAIVGFNWGGWVTGGTASEMSATRSTAAVASALTPYCLQKAQDDPMSVTVMTELDKASSYQRRSIVEKAGWATPLGAESPDRALAEACQIALKPAA
jgi:hypothetical protein